MDLAGASLVVVADGREARVFEERHRGGPLLDITARLGDLSLHRPQGSSPRGSTHDRMGPASHAGDKPTPGDRRETDFTGLVGARVARIMRGGGYDGLVLMAAPRTLGQLRRVMTRAGLIVTHAEPHDRVSESPAALRNRLRELRLRA